MVLFETGLACSFLSAPKNQAVAGGLSTGRCLSLSTPRNSVKSIRNVMNMMREHRSVQAGRFVRRFIREPVAPQTRQERLSCPSRAPLQDCGRYPQTSPLAFGEKPCRRVNELVICFAVRLWRIVSGHSDIERRLSNKIFNRQALLVTLSAWRTEPLVKIYFLPGRAAIRALRSRWSSCPWATGQCRGHNP